MHACIALFYIYVYIFIYMCIYIACSVPFAAGLASRLESRVGNLDRVEDQTKRGWWSYTDLMIPGLAVALSAGFRHIPSLGRQGFMLCYNHNAGETTFPPPPRLDSSH